MSRPLNFDEYLEQWPTSSEEMDEESNHDENERSEEMDEESNHDENESSEERTGTQPSPVEQNASDFGLNFRINPPDPLAPIDTSSLDNTASSSRSAAHAAAHEALNHPAVRVSIARHAARQQRGQNRPPDSVSPSEIGVSPTPNAVPTNHSGGVLGTTTVNASTNTHNQRIFIRQGSSFEQQQHGTANPTNFRVFAPAPNVTVSIQGGQPAGQGGQPAGQGGQPAGQRGQPAGQGGQPMAIPVPPSFMPQFHVHPPPLVAQPVPMNQIQGIPETRAVKRKKEFECLICFDYMEDPAGCGNCSSRFCHACLKKVFSGEVNSGNLSDGDTTGKCPCCRSSFTLESIVRDSDMKQRMESEEEILCPYPGCGAILSIVDGKAHDANCEFVVMKCKYATLGCSWQGPKKDLEKHNTSECAFHRVAGVIDQFRMARATHHRQITQLQQQVMHTHRIMQFHGNTLMSLQSKYSDNIFHIFELIFTATCYPVRFFVTKDIWRHFFGSPATLYNFLFLFPSLLLVARVTAYGLHSSLRFQPSDDSSTEERIEALSPILLSFISCCFGVLTILCFMFDPGLPSTWSQYTFPLNIVRPFFRDTAALCLAMIHHSCIACESGRTGLTLSAHVGVATTFLPAVLAPIIGHASNSTQDINATRARSVTLFGFRYGLLASILGVKLTFEVALIHRANVALAKRLKIDFPRWLSQEDKDCFLTEINETLLLNAYLVYVAVGFALDLKLGLLRSFFLGIGGEGNLLHAFVALLAVNGIVDLCDIIGEKVGTRIVQKASEVVQISDDDARATRNKILDGVVCFCVWLSFIGDILIA